MIASPSSRARWSWSFAAFAALAGCGAQSAADAGPEPGDAGLDVAPDAPRDNGFVCAAVCDGGCPTGSHACGGACSSDTDVATCGATCSPCAAAANANATCDGTACGLACVAGFGDCDHDAANGCEVPTTSDAANCGACGNACAAGVTCHEGACGCGGAVGAVDQAQPLATSGQYVNASVGGVGQSFTAGKTGLLTGIEMKLDVCTTMPGFSLHMVVSDAAGNALGTGDVPLVAPPLTCTGYTGLPSGPPGAGYFDLGSSCITVTAGTAYRFDVTLAGPPTKCNGGKCSAGQAVGVCISDNDCQPQPGYTFSTANPYPGGHDTRGGTAWDLAFRTYVR
ncbi:hypothetical protein [Labilithrix luteola]|nr:hypothetical protein [Labilithrix luteola]